MPNDVSLEHYTDSARNIERAFRVLLAESDEGSEQARFARAGLRNAVGVRQAMEAWPRQSKQRALSVAPTQTTPRELSTRSRLTWRSTDPATS